MPKKRYLLDYNQYQFFLYRNILSHDLNIFYYPCIVKNIHELPRASANNCVTFVKASFWYNISANTWTVNSFFFLQLCNITHVFRSQWKITKVICIWTNFFPVSPIHIFSRVLIWYPLSRRSLKLKENKADTSATLFLRFISLFRPVLSKPSPRHDRQKRNFVLRRISLSHYINFPPITTRQLQNVYSLCI